jgi:hypothetical protein
MISNLSFKVRRLFVARPFSTGFKPSTPFSTMKLPELKAELKLKGLRQKRGDTKQLIV